MENYIKVLWVEDDPLCLESYPGEAEDYGLELVSFPCWDEAEAELTKNYDDYSAIILDAKCKKSKDDEDDAQVFLSNVFPILAALTVRKGRAIPWFILSGGDKTEIGRLIPEVRKEWDDRKENYYKKATDRESLYTRIKQISLESDSVKIRKDLYPDVFKAIREIDLPQQVADNMGELLRPIHFPKVSDADTYNKLFFHARQIVEHVVKSMIGRGYIPYDEKFYKNGQINLSECSKFISGTDKKECLKNPAPYILGWNIYDIIYATGSFLHSTNEDNKKDYKTKEYLGLVGNSQYLLRSYAMQLCDLILWYNNYIKNDNQD